MAELDHFAFNDGDDDQELFSGDMSRDAVYDILTRITEQVLNGSMYERKATARNISEVFRQVYSSTDENILNVLAVIEKLLNDPEQTVRMEVLEAIPNIAVFCHEEGPRLDFVVPQHILPQIVRLLIDNFSQVRKCTQGVMFSLMERGILAPSQLEEFVCPIIQEFTRPPLPDDLRTEIATFMTKLCPLFGKEVTVNRYLAKFCRLCTDQLFQVRRVCAENMGDVADVIGTRLTELVLLPKYLALCKDDVWGVRKGCAEVFTSFAQVCKMSTRKNTLSPAFVSLLKDQNRWVRSAAFSSLGPFITTFVRGESPDMSVDSIGDFNADDSCISSINMSRDQSSVQDENDVETEESPMWSQLELDFFKRFDELEKEESSRAQELAAGVKAYQESVKATAEAKNGEKRPNFESVINPSNSTTTSTSTSKERSSWPQGDDEEFKEKGDEEEEEDDDDTNVVIEEEEDNVLCFADTFLASTSSKLENNDEKNGQLSSGSGGCEIEELMEESAGDELERMVIVQDADDELGGRLMMKLDGEWGLEKSFEEIRSNFYTAVKAYESIKDSNSSSEYDHSTDIIVDDEEDELFNTFLYWRIPLPEVDQLDINASGDQSSILVQKDRDLYPLTSQAKGEIIVNSSESSDSELESVYKRLSKKFESKKAVNSDNNSNNDETKNEEKVKLSAREMRNMQSFYESSSSISNLTRSPRPPLIINSNSSRYNENLQDLSSQFDENNSEDPGDSGAEHTTDPTTEGGAEPEEKPVDVVPIINENEDQDQEEKKDGDQEKNLANNETSPENSRGFRVGSTTDGDNDTDETKEKNEKEMMFEQFEEMSSKKYIIRVSDVQRSYWNLYNASTRGDQVVQAQQSQDNSIMMGGSGGMDIFKGFNSYSDMEEPNSYDEDSDQYSSPFHYGEEMNNVWGVRGCKERLLAEIPKLSTPRIQEIVPNQLIEHFTAMCESSQGLESDMASSCVFNLPAVVWTLGPQNWSILRDCYESLACSMQWKVRYTLASSLHEIAKILGPELAERDLVPFFNSLTKDLDEVRLGILKNLAEFIRILGRGERKKCLESLSSFLVAENKRNWRFRMELAHQTVELTEMFEPDDVLKFLCPLAIELMLDSVAEVRTRALDLVPHLVKALNNDNNSNSKVNSNNNNNNNSSHNNSSTTTSTINNEDSEMANKDESSSSSLNLTLPLQSPNSSFSSTCQNQNQSPTPHVKEFILQLVNTLGHSPRWIRRQSFASLSMKLSGSLPMVNFAQDILPHLINLSSDKVPNVRLVVAQTLQNIIKYDYFDPSNPHTEILTTTISKLQKDSDRDVRFYSGIPIEFTSPISEEFVDDPSNSSLTGDITFSLSSSGDPSGGSDILSDMNMVEVTEVNTSPDEDSSTA